MPAEKLLLQCPTCKRNFGKKFSLLRHSKICSSPASNPKQKSCDGCSTTKTRCDLQWPSCDRCISRNTPCRYKNHVHKIKYGSPSIGTFTYPSQAFVGNNDTLFPNFDHQLRNDTRIDEQSGAGSVATRWLPPLDNGTELSFSSLMAHFAERDKTRTHMSNERAALSPDACLQPIIPLSKVLSPPGKHSMEYTFRVFRTWPHMMAGISQDPPIFHHSQLVEGCMATPLKTCYTIAKMWHDQSDKSASFVRDTAFREMTKLFRNYRKFDEADLLAAMQAIAIYVIILLFPTQDQASVSVFDMAVLANVQELANHVGSVGLLLREESQHVRPSWEAWVNIASRRRAILALYLLHWVLSMYHGLPSFDCHELRYMLAPAPKHLWQTKDREEWIAYYNLWLVEWGQHEFLHGEISEATAGVKLDRRVEKWFQETDELGMLCMLLAEKVIMDGNNG